MKLPIFFGFYMSVLCPILKKHIERSTMFKWPYLNQIFEYNTRLLYLDSLLKYFEHPSSIYPNFEHLI